MDARRAKKICKEFEFTMVYCRRHDPHWAIDNPKTRRGHGMPNAFFKALSEEDFIRYMKALQEPVV